ncbi:MAG: hypothetical protein QM753_04515 [Thermomicrobiales bacterium]
MSFNAYTPPGFWDRTRFARFGFLAGIVVGILIGWFFHGVVSLIMRVGFVIALLIPLAIVLWLWWRSSRTPMPTERPRSSIQWVEVNTQGFDPGPRRRQAAPESEPAYRYEERPGDVILDLDDLPPSRDRERPS